MQTIRKIVVILRDRGHLFGEFFSFFSYRNEDTDVPVYFGRTEVIIVRWQMVKIRVNIA